MITRYSHRMRFYESVDELLLWVETSSTLKRVASRPQYSALIHSSLASQMSGEGDLSSLESTHARSEPSNEAAASPTISPTLSSTLLEDTTPEQITYQPDVYSYPLMIYDRLVDAPTPQTAVPCDSTFYVPFSTMGSGEFELPDIPLSVPFALFNGHNVQDKAAKKQQNESQRRWWDCIWGRQHVLRQTLADKPQKYTPLTSGSSIGTNSITEGAPTTAATSATPERAENTPIRLRKLMPATKRQQPPSPSLPPWQSPTPTRNTTLVTHNQGQRNSSSATFSSPANRFLPYPLQPRLSSEYLAAHGAFFSKPLPTPPLPQSSAHLSPYPSRSASPGSDLDALEAQSDSVVEPRRSRSVRSVMHIADGVDRTGEKLWIGRWIGAVEEGVNKAVDAVVRWTEDEGAEEGLLLPAWEAGGSRSYGFYSRCSGRAA
ncbi:uncharacterized protein CC84DRAFT_1206308 [Paraphaeosphaeria sporulosa]|uniref:Uncharacterized protein n=1 Tax=Paraphaeosphaeria sporulosa TaxID=1460663 RepID=A0A177CD26_9PLEO|nr:uncharacterized protein CC84DRAFT_1206308 [Paraphaeosphaeria sporulosa]OAG04699.1 hypothetical protein CC84DRAFT_1206308 [Paraphaeosphaeria sporulosa]